MSQDVTFDRDETYHPEFSSLEDDRPGQQPHQGAIAQQVVKYYFSLRSDLVVLRGGGPAGDRHGFDVPEGIRLHVQYEPKGEDGVYSDEASYQAYWRTSLAEAQRVAAGPMPPAGWFGIHGRILSGGDWVLVQKNGVLIIDARATVKTDDNVLIDVTLSGAVDLASALKVPVHLPANKLGAFAYERYRNGYADFGRLPLSLAVRFEAAGDPYLRPGEDGAWIENSRYAQQRRHFWKYQKLLRGQFVALGHLQINAREPRWPAKRIHLQVFELVSR